MSSFSQNPESILPTPDSTFFNHLDTNRLNNAEYIIEKYIGSYFILTKEKEVIMKAGPNHPEIPGEDCLTRTEYGRIAIEVNWMCEDLFLTKTIEFNKYSLKEVKRILKILLPKEYNRENDKGDPGDDDGWNEDAYYNYDDMCALDILVENNKILVQYGCSC